MAEGKPCYSHELGHGWWWCDTHKIAFQHEYCPKAKGEAQGV